MSNNPYYEQDTEFVLGFAGSGKSTELAKRATKKTLILVPTHKAASVLFNKGLEHVYTIHSVLKLVPSINENFKKKMTTKLKQIGSTDLSEITDIFIDEFSMINAEILDLLMASLPDSAKVTIFGDPYQLPPVTGDKIEPWEPITELTTQHRSKNIRGTKIFMSFMESIRDYSATPVFSYVIDNKWTEKFNPESDRVLAYTNKRVIQLNNMLEDNKEFYYNEILSINGIPMENVVEDYKPRIYPSCISKGVLMSGQELIKASTTATNDINKYRTNLQMYKTMMVKTELGDTYLIYFDPNHYETEQRLKKDVESWQMKVIKDNNLAKEINIPTFCRENRKAPGVYERGKAWSKYLAHTNYVFNVTRTHATTIHKAQGSEFSKVFIDMDNIKIANKINPEMYKRLMYVATSRSIDEIIFI